MSNKAVKTGGMYRNRSEYFADVPGPDADKGAQPGQLKDGYSFVPHQDAPNAVAYTQRKTPQKGGGFKYGEKRMIYKKVDTPAPTTTAAPTPEPEAPAPEPEKERTPIEHSSEVKQAIERVRAYENNILDGTQGSDFKLDESPDAQNFADKYKLNLLNKGETSSDFSGV